MERSCRTFWYNSAANQCYNFSFKKIKFTRVNRAVIRVIPILYCVCVTIFSISHQSNSNKIHYLNKKKLTQHFKLKIIVKMDDSKELKIFSRFFSFVCSSASSSIYISSILQMITDTMIFQ